MTDNLPSLPSLGPNETLAFFTLKSIRLPMEGVELFYGDHEGLADLGTDVFQLCVYEAFVRNHTSIDFSVHKMKVGTRCNNELHLT